MHTDPTLDSLSTSDKLERLKRLILQSQVYSQIIVDSMLERDSGNARHRLEAAQSSHCQKQPNLVRGEMKDYQLDGLGWLVSLYENGLNGILADEMGLGKTLQCIALLCHLKENKVKGPFLVVAPLSTLHNWIDEIGNFAPSLKTLLYHGLKQDRNMKKLSGAEVVVTSYEMIVKDFKRFKPVLWSYLVVDEGHRLKNFECTLIQQLKKLDSANRLLLTGTPLQNNLSELWSLLNFILPDIFKDLDLFQKWFDFGLAEGQDESIQKEVEEQLVESLHSVLKPFLLRRFKKDVLQHLPHKKEYIVYASLTPLQQVVYNAVVDKTMNETLIELYTKESLMHQHPKQFSTEKDLKAVDEYLASLDEPAAKRQRTERFTSEEISEYFSDSESPQPPKAKPRRSQSKKHQLIASMHSRAKKHVTNLHLLSPTMQMRNACASHYLYYTPKTDFVELLQRNTCKFHILKQLLTALVADNHKVLIFSQFTRVMDLMEPWLESLDIAYSRLDGSYLQSERMDEVVEFNKSTELSQVFVLSTRAGGLGLNLVAADTVILFDSDWNPQMDLQAVDRVHRIGQTKPVKVFRFIVKDTIEELVLLKSFSKRILEKRVIQQGNYSLGKVAKQLKDENIDVMKVTMSKAIEAIKHRSASVNINEALLHDAQEQRLSNAEIDDLMDRSEKNYKTLQNYDNVVSLSGA